MKRWIFLLVLLVPLAAIAGSLEFDGDGSNGFETGESVTAANMNQINTAVDGNASDITALQAVDASFPGDNIQDGTIDASELAVNSVGAAEISAGAVAGSELAGNAVTSDKIFNGTILGADISALAITEGLLASNAVTSAKIADGEVSTDDILDATILGADIANLAITAGLIASNAVTNAKMADNAIGSAEITDGSVAAADVAADVATQAELDAKSVASSTDNAIPKFDSTSGDIQNTGVTINDSNDVSTAGALNLTGSGGTCLMLRDIADDAYTECWAADGAISCTVDADGVCDGS